MADDAPIPYEMKLADGTIMRGVDKKLHSVDDEPAVIYADGTRWWYKNGKVHRDGDQPAIIFANGTREWWQNNQRHRPSGGPTVIYGADAHPKLRGHQEWHQNHKLVRKTHSVG